MIEADAYIMALQVGGSKALRNCLCWSVPHLTRIHYETTVQRPVPKAGDAIGPIEDCTVVLAMLGV